MFCARDTLANAERTTKRPREEFQWGEDNNDSTAGLARKRARPKFVLRGEEIK